MLATTRLRLSDFLLHFYHRTDKMEQKIIINQIYE